MGRDHHAHAASLLVLAIPLLLAGSAIPLRNPAPVAFPPKTGADALPDAPEKSLVLQYCDMCHTLDWIAHSGGTTEGWTDRLNRMIRAGATIPRDQIPAVAAYLGKALPPRPRPQGPPRSPAP